MTRTHKKHKTSNDKNDDSHGREEEGLLASLDALSDADLRAELERNTRDATELIPHAFQLDAVIALWRNRDLIVIAGTGRGKTLAFVMPCFLSKMVTVVVISPLNALMDDQVSLTFGSLKIAQCTSEGSSIPRMWPASDICECRGFAGRQVSVESE
jgi:ATP-dependent helicase YprA (DUF1998 family)